MNSINERLARLQKKLIPQPRTKRQMHRAKEIANAMTQQNGCCATCNIQFDSYELPNPDWIDKSHLQLRGLLCKMCYGVVMNTKSGKVLENIFKYLNKNMDDWRK